MGVQVSEVSICNQGLSWLGQDSIASLEDDSDTAKLCKANYGPLRDAVLTEVAWTFATGRLISITADLDDWGQRYKHAIPHDWLQVLRVYRNVSSDRKLKSDGWVREGSFILSKDATVYMWGIKRIADTSLFSPAFAQCLAARIAADICVGVTENLTLQGTMYQLYGAKLKEAAISDGIQGSNEVIESNTLIDARSGSGFGY